MVKKKMQKPVKIFFRAFADRSISLPVLLGSYHFAPEPVNDFRGLEMGAMNTAESAFSMRRTQKTVAASGNAGDVGRPNSTHDYSRGDAAGLNPAVGTPIVFV